MSKFGQHFKKHYKKKLQCCVCYCNINKRIYHRCFKRHFRKSSQEDFEKSTHHIMCSNCERHQYRIMGESFRCPICKEKWKLKQKLLISVTKVMSVFNHLIKNLLRMKS